MSDRHIVLTGPLGAGKTTLGSALAEALGRSFLDSDAWFIATHGETGREIAQREGVAHLHVLENHFVRRAIESEPSAVVAAPASVADDAAFMKLLMESGCQLVYLEADASDLPPSADRRTHGGPTDENNARRRAARSAGATVVDTGAAASLDTIVKALIGLADT